MKDKIIGIDLGGTSAKMAIISLTGDVLEKWSVSTNILEEGTHIVPNLIESLKERIELYKMKETDFLGIGMGSPGKVDADAKTVIGAYNLNWSTLQEIGKAFGEKFDIPFFIENDANIAALGEQWRGAGEGALDCITVTLGTGVGGGVVVNGQLVRGVNGAAGEIGHLTIDTEGHFDCTCGKKGCLETVASATGIMHLARKFAQEYVGDSEVKAQLDDGADVNSKDIFDAAKEGDYFALQVVDHFAHYLGLACSHLANTLNPSKIVLAGGVALAGDFLLNKVNEQFMGYCFPQIRHNETLVLAKLGNDAGIMGAAQLVKLQSVEG
ncbi:ROK family glucokinase [Fundicoccus ignavus]|uniref:Glucokinase n=1 Tax=Fundicoccus ignavus TaxID=2664442 RepID=A0A844BWS7_9LACT|nr:ROK family glucokinase [Fundicoccus ignavus]MRJ46504.1 ROK family glucokinase [Fundicoccus ignavus]